MSTFIALDGSIRNVGLVMGTFDSTGLITPQNGVLFKTQATKNKKLSKVEDFINRCGYLYLQVNNLIGSVKPDYVFIESPMGSKNNAAAKSAAAMCMLAGALRANVANWNGKLITVTPIEVKKAALGVNDASKEDMISWAVEKYPKFPFYKSKNGEVYAYNEHLADAIAVTYAGVSKIEE